MNIGNFRYTGGFRFESTTVREYRRDYPREYELSGGEILLVMTCQTAGGEILGIPARVPSDGRTYRHNQRLGRVIVKKPHTVHNDYLYWLFLSPTFNRELCLSASGTKILHTAPTRIESVRIKLPSLDEQGAIAHILGTLDDKIELNRQMNETLEAMARALFQSWFAACEPVRAKAADLIRDGIWRSLDSSRLHPVILYCWMQSNDMGEQLAAMAGQTDMAPYVSLQDQRQMSMPDFPPSQHAIASRIEALRLRYPQVTRTAGENSPDRESPEPRHRSECRAGVD